MLKLHMLKLHMSEKMIVPEGISLEPLLPYSPELQPAAVKFIFSLFLRLVLKTSSFCVAFSSQEALLIDK